ncbi:WXG100 family type VII secretion target [Kitasatospora purpeofusca]|uniref:WXG100 family type VII secretion target n=1 Tax=Kitasatospora purpeofusca TaxID=67352 RepID=UPI002258AD55|nr:WXG100 family type VII secretion target [Kitasatospora purpeofusca]MCX4689533.1 WXG100 family type VII secretion target [Kitasatospora purpeofusca]
MPNISLDFEKIETTSAQLDSAAENIVPMLNDLKNNVNNLLGDGMVFQQSSPAMQEAYDKFNTSLLAAMEGIKGFAKQFRQIKDQMHQMDQDMASSLRESS